METLYLHYYLGEVKDELDWVMDMPKEAKQPGETASDAFDRLVVSKILLPVTVGKKGKLVLL